MVAGSLLWANPLVAQTPAFKDVTGETGLKISTGAACWVDLDNDGWVDLSVSGGIWKNNAGKTFTRVADVPTAVAADYDNDGDADLYAAAATATGLVAGGHVSADSMMSPAEPIAADGPVFVSTWAFGQVANETGMRSLTADGSLLDAIEIGVREIESDASNHSVGFGGTPNADGVVQLDACIMDHRYNAGNVTAIEEIAHPISVARMIMERTKHVMLAGAGARKFALEQGMEAIAMLTEDRRQK